MEIRIQGNDHRALHTSPFHDYGILRLRHADFASVREVEATLAKHRGGVTRHALIEEESKRDLHRAFSSRGGFRLVFKIRGCKRESLTKILWLKFRVVPNQALPVRINRDSFDDPANGKSHPANARLPIHLSRIPSDAIK